MVTLFQAHFYAITERRREQTGASVILTTSFTVARELPVALPEEC
jgi:hypothetical protein